MGGRVFFDSSCIFAASVCYRFGFVCLLFPFFFFSFCFTSHDCMCSSLAWISIDICLRLSAAVYQDSQQSIALQ